MGMHVKISVDKLSKAGHLELNMSEYLAIPAMRLDSELALALEEETWIIRGPDADAQGESSNASSSSNSISSSNNSSLDAV